MAILNLSSMSDDFFDFELNVSQGSPRGVPWVSSGSLSLSSCPRTSGQFRLRVRPHGAPQSSARQRVTVVSVLLSSASGEYPPKKSNSARRIPRNFACQMTRPRGVVFVALAKLLNAIGHQSTCTPRFILKGSVLKP